MPCFYWALRSLQNSIIEFLCKLLLSNLKAFTLFYHRRYLQIFRKDQKQCWQSVIVHNQEDLSLPITPFCHRYFQVKQPNSLPKPASAYSISSLASKSATSSSRLWITIALAFHQWISGRIQQVFQLFPLVAVSFLPFCILLFCFLWFWLICSFLVLYSLREGLFILRVPHISI